MQPLHLRAVLPALPARKAQDRRRFRFRRHAAFTALAARALMLRTRSWSAAWSRFILVGCLILVMVEDASHAVVAGGLTLLSGIAFTATFLASAAVLVATASAIAEEKEQGTLGLLRMAGLGPVGILLAKGGTRLVEAWMLTAMTLPMALAAVAIGGVSAVQVLALYVLILVWLSVVAGVGLVCSVLCATTAQALRLGAAVLLVFVIVPWLCSVGRYAPEPSLNAFTWMSVILGAGFSGPVIGPCIIVHALLAYALAVLAWRCFPAGDAPRAPVTAAPVQARARWLRDLPRASRPPGGLAALRWKEFHHVHGGWRGLLIAAATPPVISFALLALVERSFDLVGKAFPGVLFWIAFLYLVWQVGLRLSTTCAAEIRAGTFDDLRTLPRPLWQVLMPKLGAIGIGAVPTLAVCVVAAFLLMRQLSAQDLDALTSPPMVGWTVATVLGFWSLCLYTSLRVPAYPFTAAVVILFAIFIGEGLLIPFGSSEALAHLETILLFIIAGCALFWAVDHLHRLDRRAG
jgi:hypothetical protein